MDTAESMLMEYEDDHLPYIRSKHMNAERMKEQLDRILAASEEAQKKIDYATAHNEQILRAIDVVEEFLRKKHRLCYGGQAINAHLPEPYKFYDPTYSIPDYDFFTPQPEKDLQQITKDLIKAGFQEVSIREGIHAGTMKVYVEYIPVADVTEMDPALYRLLSKREFRQDGISYMDANTLKMLMYLELSRPRGDVSRWPKVYERLALLSTFSSRKTCVHTHPFTGTLTSDQLNIIMDFIVEKKRVLAGGDVMSFYKQAASHRHPSLELLFRTKQPLLFFSSTPKEDAITLQQLLRVNVTNRQDVIAHTSYVPLRTELLPSLEILHLRKQPIVLIIHQTSCHSYYSFPLQDGSGSLLVASLDTLITLYFSLGLTKTRYFDLRAMECLAEQLSHLTLHIRKHPSSLRLPFISIRCSGYQRTFPSLVRSKVRRITRKRKEDMQKRILLLTNRTTLKK